MKASRKAIELIKRFEGVELQAYICPAGVPTIGYGHTKGVQMGDIITMVDADALLVEDLAIFERDVDRLVKSQINQSQYDALISFTYNLGASNLRTSTLLKKVNANPNDPSIAYEFSRWNKARGVELRGLTERRAAEAELYFNS